MKTENASVPGVYFDRLYSHKSDPWNFGHSVYERQKYNATLTALGAANYNSALEIGCSIGVLSAALSLRCKKLLCVDSSEIALAQARRQCKSKTNIIFEQCQVPDRFPPGGFDFILISEVLYYLDATDIRRLALTCGKALKVRGEIVLCHWLGKSITPTTGKAASDIFANAIRPRLPIRIGFRDCQYRLEKFCERTDRPRS